MLLFKKAKDINNYILSTLQDDKSVGFAPTMGALHAGHISLITHAKNDKSIVISSIFVNPTQFNNKEDLAKYPKTIEQDIAMLESAGCDALYMPDVDDIYPDGMDSKIVYNLEGYDAIMEGTFRPGHFQGVAQVVDRLLTIIPANYLYLGEKDLQQVAVIKQMAKQYHPNTNIKTVPTLRESDGLAMSSRNTRLDADSRAKAPLIYQSLKKIIEQSKYNSFQKLREEALSLLSDNGFQTDYLALLDFEQFQLMDDFNPNVRSFLLIATYIGGVRLIDNMEVK